jgi:xanthine dehydrogenase YagS FAD-binding subunit
MKEEVERPSRLIDISRLPLRTIEETAQGGVRIGALVPNSDLAWHPLIEQRYPLLSSAILAGASAQLRNMASTGGNLLQRTRCFYFYDTATPCNKRDPGSGCSAINGINRINAILGTSEACIATHPSDMCVALAALEATVHVTGPAGERTIAFADFHRLPGNTPEIDSNLDRAEIVTGIELPPRGFAANYSYLKIRDRLSYAFALVSVAAALELEGGRIKDARLALGGVAHKPWRDPAAEAVLRDQTAHEATFMRAAEVLLRDARSFEHNRFKIDLARRAIVRALTQAANATPQSQSNKKIR